MAGSEHSKQAALQYIAEDFQESLLKEIAPLLSSGSKPEEIENKINSLIEQRGWKGRLSQDKLNFSLSAVEKVTTDEQMVASLTTTGCFLGGRWHAICPVR